MARVIWKYPLSLFGQAIELPIIRQIVKIGPDPMGNPCVWALVDPDGATEVVELYIVGTGQPLPHGAGLHLGSFLDGSFVWHVFGAAQ